MERLWLNERIAAYRKAKGVTQEELAKALGVTNQAVSKWESGQCCPDIQLLPDIADYFGVSIDALMGHRPIPADEDRTNRIISEAIVILNNSGLVSTSYLQRKLCIGYGKAKEIIDLMEKRGFIVPSGNGNTYFKKC